MLEIIDNIGYMKLMDGTSLLAHKKSTEQKIEDNKKAGHVFSNEESEMFFKNAYFLWKHRAEIRKDSKMLLASVRVSSGTANCCSLKDATLGAFLDFWDTTEGAPIKNSEGNNAVLCRIGLGRSEADTCKLADELGNVADTSIDLACHRLSKFAAINRHYHKYAEQYEACSLESVLVSLQMGKRESKWPLYRENIKLFYEHREEICKRKEWFYATIPLSVFGTRNPIFVGVMLTLWQRGNERFMHKCEKCGHTAYVYSFAGSPMSGIGSISYQCFHCGEYGHIAKDGFGSRMKALKDIREELLKDKEGVDEVPLETLIANLMMNFKLPNKA